MGVPYFVGQIIRGIKKINKYNQILVKTKIYAHDSNMIEGDIEEYYNKIYNGIVSSFSIDLNALIHYVAGNVYGYINMEIDEEKELKPLSKKQQKEKLNEFNEILWSNILLLYNVTRPRDIFILAADGIAAAGKIIQQRRRRFAKNPYFNPIFDSNSISPGTDFMIEIDKFIRKKFIENKNYFNCKILYSSHMVPGEGEHKIFEYLRSNIILKRSKEVHIIHGLDADLVMLSLLSPCFNIVLMRENNDKKNESVREVIDDKVYTSLLDIETFKAYILSKNIPLKDYVLMAMIIGNDFIPHHVALKDISDSIGLFMYIHNKLKLKLINGNNQINFREFRKFIHELYLQESNTISSKINEINPNKLIIASTEYDNINKINKFNYAKFRKLWYERCLGISVPNHDKILYDILHHKLGNDIPKNLFAVKKIDIENMTMNYIKILNWNFIYYNEGYKKVDDSIEYYYDFSPLFIDILNSLTNLIKQDIMEIEGIRATSLDNNFTVLHQLVSVLPMSSIELIPKNLKFLFDINSPIIDLFPISWNQILEGTDKTHLTIHRIPIPIRKRIIDVFNDIKFEPKFLNKYIPQKDLYIN